MNFNSSVLSSRGISLAAAVCIALGAGSTLSAQTPVFSIPLPFQQTLARVPFMKTLPAGTSTTSVGILAATGNVPNGWRLVIEHLNASWTGNSTVEIEMLACTQSSLGFGLSPTGLNKTANMNFSLAPHPGSAYTATSLATGSWPVRMYAEDCSVSPSLAFGFSVSGGALTQVVPAGATVTVVGYVELIQYVGPPL